MGSSTIYDIKSQTKKLRDYMKATDIPKAAENRHTLQYHRGEMIQEVRQKSTESDDVDDPEGVE